MLRARVPAQRAHSPRHLHATHREHPVPKDGCREGGRLPLPSLLASRAHPQALRAPSDGHQLLLLIIQYVSNAFLSGDYAGMPAASPSGLTEAADSRVELPMAAPLTHWLSTHDRRAPRRLFRAPPLPSCDDRAPRRPPCAALFRVVVCKKNIDSERAPYSVSLASICCFGPHFPHQNDDCLLHSPPSRQLLPVHESTPYISVRQVGFRHV